MRLLLSKGEGGEAVRALLSGVEGKTSVRFCVEVRKRALCLFLSGGDRRGRACASKWR